MVMGNKMIAKLTNGFIEDGLKLKLFQTDSEKPTGLTIALPKNVRQLESADYH